MLLEGGQPLKGQPAGKKHSEHGIHSRVCWVLPEYASNELCQPKINASWRRRWFGPTWRKEIRVVSFIGTFWKNRWSQSKPVEPIYFYANSPTKRTPTVVSFPEFLQFLDKKAFGWQSTSGFVFATPIGEHLPTQGKYPSSFWTSSVGLGFESQHVELAILEAPKVRCKTYGPTKPAVTRSTVGWLKTENRTISSLVMLTPDS